MKTSIIAGLVLAFAMATTVATAAPKSDCCDASKCKTACCKVACCDAPCCASAKKAGKLAKVKITKSATVVTRAVTKKKTGSCCAMPCCNGGACCGSDCK